MLTSRWNREEAYPSRPIHLIVGFTAGAASDVTARILGDSMRPILSQQIIVEDRPGAGSSIAAEYADEIPDEKIPKDMLELASHIVETKAGHFEPQKFEDQYEDALKELIRKKQPGQPIERPERREPSKVINLMDALRRSVEASREPGKRQAPPSKPRSSQSEPSKKKKSR